jgi:NAD(P)-dependent dehydrogenase (short-subunit alcohol dehydrogenase family)
MATIALTGGASGIGATLSEQLRHDNHTVINVDIRDAEVIADLTTNKGRSAALAEIAARAPDGLDGFVPLAGLGSATGHPATLITALNYFGAVSLVEGLRPLLAKKSGSVVLLCSNSAPMSSREDLLLAPLLEGDETAALKVAEQETGMEYMAGKRALAYWMRKNSFDYARAGIRINAVAPGPIQTPMVEALFEKPGMKDVVDTLLRATPIERMGQPHEVANAIRFLLSGDASYICGTVLFIDGGYDAAIRPENL